MDAFIDSLAAKPGAVVGVLPRDTTLTITDPIFVMAAGGPSGPCAALSMAFADGWVAQYTQTGIVLIEPFQPLAAIPWRRRSHHLLPPAAV